MVVPNVVLMACGSFNPPTPMHFRLFEIARDHFKQMGTHNVIGGIMSPVHDAYKKTGLVSASHRCNMIRLGLQTSDWIRLSDWETRQDDWTRTRISLQYHQNYINSYLNDDLNEDTTDLQLPQWLPVLQNRLHSGREPVQLKLLCGADILESFSVPNLWDPEDVSSAFNRGVVSFDKKSVSISVGDHSWPARNRCHHKKRIESGAVHFQFRHAEQIQTQHHSHHELGLQRGQFHNGTTPHLTGRQCQVPAGRPDSGVHQE